jgi:hypothetical protein
MPGSPPNGAERRKERKLKKKEQELNRRRFEERGQGVAVYANGKVIQLVDNGLELKSQMEYGNTERSKEVADKKLVKIEDKLTKLWAKHDHLVATLRKSGALGDGSRSKKQAHLGGAAIVTGHKQKQDHQDMLVTRKRIEIVTKERDRVKVDGLVATKKLAEDQDESFLNLPPDAQSLKADYKRRRMEEWQEKWNDPGDDLTPAGLEEGRQKQRHFDAKRRLSPFSTSPGVSAAFRASRKLDRRARKAVVSNDRRNEKNLSQGFKERRKNEPVVNIFKEDARIRKRIDARYEELCRPRRKIVEEINTNTGEEGETKKPKEGMWDVMDNKIKREKEQLFKKMRKKEERVEKVKRNALQEADEKRRKKETEGILPKLAAAQQTVRDGAAGLLSSVSDSISSISSSQQRAIREARKGLLKNLKTVGLTRKKAKHKRAEW